MSVRSTVEDAATKAGWNVTDCFQYDNSSVDMECDNGVDYLNIQLMTDGTYVWNDFTHQTILGTNEKELVEAFTELLPLRNEGLAEWIAQRRYDKTESAEKVYRDFMRVAAN